jgi:hypothetical protein
MKTITVAIALLVGSPAWAQESRVASDWRRERERIADNCGTFDAKKLTSCAMALITGYPVHIALGNLAPQNGFAFGGAFVERYTPNEDWRLSFSADAVTTTSKAWRAGGYVTFIRSKVPLPKVTTGAVTTSPTNVIHQYPVFRLYVQHTSLNTLHDYGPDFDNPVLRVFSEDHTIFGGSAVLPVNQESLRALALSFIGGANGRFIAVDDATDSDAFFELFEELRGKPALFGDHLRLNYAARWHQFLGETDLAFHRWTVDLRHEIPLYRTVASTGPSQFNGPNECSTSPSSLDCPEVTYSRNRGGSIGVRLRMLSSSPFDDAGSVPFYLQPTIGGSDINGQRVLASFDDYRFRGPHMLVAEASLEHSIWGPLGAYINVETGKATQQRS